MLRLKAQTSHISVKALSIITERAKSAVEGVEPYHNVVPDVQSKLYRIYAQFVVVALSLFILGKLGHE